MPQQTAIQVVRKYALALAIAWTGVIFGLCCTPGRYVPTARWLDLLSFDKFVHASIFFILASLWMLVLSRSARPLRPALWIAVVACIAYGGILEIMQATVFSQRSGDWADFIANSFGCFFALWLFRRKNGFMDPSQENSAGKAKTS